MLEFDIFFNLFIEDCMFITSIIENTNNAALKILIIIGHTHGFEEV